MENFPTVRFHPAGQGDIQELDSVKANNFTYLQKWVEDNSKKYRVAFNFEQAEGEVVEPEDLGELEEEEEEEEEEKEPVKPFTDEETVEL